MPEEQENPKSLISSRFKGERGIKLLCEVLSQSFLFNSISNIQTIVEDGELLDIASGNCIIEQGGSDNDLYLIISGKFEILVNNRVVAHRLPVNHVGEMALIDFTARRSATVRAVEDSLVLKMSEEKFSELADKNPVVWRRVSSELSRRLVERSKFVKEPRSQPVIFIASSTEGLKIAREIQNCFVHDPFIVNIWTDNVFAPTSSAIEDLLEKTKNIDFGIVVLTADDAVTSRDMDQLAPRDNVIFELGLILGSIGRERTFIISQRGKDIKIPSDLLGVSHLNYAEGDLTTIYSRISPACNDIRKIINTKNSI